MAQNDTLTKNQRRALAALLAHKTATAAAEASGISRSTIARYLSMPAFRAEMARAEGELIDAAAGILLEGLSAALATLNDIRRNGKKDSDRRQAAEAWIELALRLVELRNFEMRLAALEEAMHEN
jgi:hypothetical protein